MNNNDMAQAVEDALRGVQCPFCNADIDSINKIWVVAYCKCGKNFYRNKTTPGYRAGRYWTPVWEWSYEAGRPTGAKPVRLQPKILLDDWTVGVNRNKPKRSNSRSGKKKSALRAKRQDH